MEGYSRNEEKKLELRLGPPNGDWSREKDEALFPFGYNISTNNGSQVQQQKFSSFLQLQTTPQKQSVMAQESLQTAGCSKAVDMQKSAAEKKAFSPATKTGPVPNSAQKR